MFAKNTLKRGKRENWVICGGFFTLTLGRLGWVAGSFSIWAHSDDSMVRYYNRVFLS